MDLSLANAIEFLKDVATSDDIVITLKLSKGSKVVTICVPKNSVDVKIQ